MIYYLSRTGNNKHIIQSLQLPSKELSEDIIVTKPFILLTYTDGLGSTPKPVDLFLKNNYQYCKGVAVSGNSNFGSELFCKAADNIYETYRIPIICKMELRGFQKDYDKIIQFYKEFILEESL